MRKHLSFRKNVGIPILMHTILTVFYHIFSLSLLRSIDTQTARISNDFGIVCLRKRIYSHFFLRLNGLIFVNYMCLSTTWSCMHRCIPISSSTKIKLRCTVASHSCGHPSIHPSKLRIPIVRSRMKNSKKKGAKIKWMRSGEAKDTKTQWFGNLDLSLRHCNWRCITLVACTVYFVFFCIVFHGIVLLFRDQLRFSFVSNV